MTDNLGLAQAPRNARRPTQTWSQVEKVRCQDTFNLSYVYDDKVKKLNKYVQQQGFRCSRDNYYPIFEKALGGSRLHSGSMKSHLNKSVTQQSCTSSFINLAKRYNRDCLDEDRSLLRKRTQRCTFSFELDAESIMSRFSKILKSSQTPTPQKIEDEADYGSLSTSGDSIKQVDCFNSHSEQSLDYEGGIDFLDLSENTRDSSIFTMQKENACCFYTDSKFVIASSEIENLNILKQGDNSWIYETENDHDGHEVLKYDCDEFPSLGFNDDFSVIG